MAPGAPLHLLALIPNSARQVRPEQPGLAQQDADEATGTESRNGSKGARPRRVGGVQSARGSTSQRPKTGAARRRPMPQEKPELPQRPHTTPGRMRREGQESMAEPSRTTLFRDHIWNGSKRCGAVIFRRPVNSTFEPHRRPVFVAGPNGEDPRICIDFTNPRRFSSFEAARHERLMQGNFKLPVGLWGPASGELLELRTPRPPTADECGRSTPAVRPASQGSSQLRVLLPLVQ